MAEQEDRRERLEDIAKRTCHCGIHSAETQEALDGGHVPRYAVLTTEGTSESSYADNGNLLVFDTQKDLCEAAASEAEEGWAPKGMWDLDGPEADWGNLDWTTKVVITGRHS